MPNLNEYPMGTRISIGDRSFYKGSASSFWREEHRIPGNCVSRPASTMEGIEERVGLKHLVVGFFVDWDGCTRRVEAPGDCYSCKVVPGEGYIGVDVLDLDGCVCFEAVYYPTIAAIQAIGVPVNIAA